MKMNTDNNNSTWCNLNDTQTHTKRKNNHVYDKTDKHAHVNVGFLVSTIRRFHIWVASKFKRLNQSCVIPRSCWHKVHPMITSIRVFGLSDVHWRHQSWVGRLRWPIHGQIASSNSTAAVCWQTEMQRCDRDCSCWIPNAQLTLAQQCN